MRVWLCLLAVLSVARGQPPLGYVLDGARRICDEVWLADGVWHSRCGNDTCEYVRQLLEKPRVEWAWTMFDSSTKLWDGLLDGNLVQLGNYDECVEVQATTATTEFSGQHCLTSLAVANTSLFVKMAFCIPSTCSAQQWQDMAQSLVGHRANVSLSENDCHTSQSPDMDWADWFAVGVLLLFGLLVILSTAYDLVTHGSDRRRPLPLAFSVYTNGRRLLSTSTSQDTLQAVHGIRFLSISWVILGHVYYDETFMPAINLKMMGEFMHDWKRMYAMNATLSVDTFFLLSGMLVSYVFLKQMVGSRARFNPVLYYVHRYVRLTPALACMVLLQATLLMRAGSGPLWTSGMGPMTDDCRTHWWSTLLYVQNYVNPNRLCLGHSWYLAVDMQLYWLSPLLLLPLLKAPRLGYALLSVLVLAGLASAFTVSYVNKLVPVMMTGTAETGKDVMALQYEPTHARFTPWLLGVALGCLLHATHGREVKLPKWAVALGWTLAAASSLGSQYGMAAFMELDFVYHRVADSFYVATFRSLWVIGVAWLVFACDKGYGGPVNTFLSWKVFQPLGRLSYSMYLTHLPYQFIKVYTTRTPVYLGDSYAIPSFLGDMLAAGAMAMALSLVLESPAIIIEKQLLTTGRGKNEGGTKAKIGQAGGVVAPKGRC